MTEGDITMPTEDTRNDEMVALIEGLQDIVRELGNWYWTNDDRWQMLDACKIFIYEIEKNMQEED